MISVVVPARNAVHALPECLAALKSQIYDGGYEIIVVDDGSTDNTAAVAETAGVVLLRQANRGAAAARNVGIRAARGEIICFTDADCVPTADWLAQMVAPLQDPAIIGCKGVYATRQRELVARFVQIEYEDKYDKLRSQPRIDFVDTYSAAFRRDVLVANGGFDERFPRANAEDRELSHRLASRGYQMVFQPRAVVYHTHSATLGDYWRKKMSNGYWVAQVISRFPHLGVKDSYTPQVMKVQMALMALFLVSLAALPAVLLTPWGAAPPLFILLVFLATTLPFVRKAWAKDRAVALYAPFLLAARALGLGLGYGWGLIRPRAGISGNETTIGGVAYLLKRAMDVVVSFFVLIPAAFLVPFWGVAIVLSRPGPLFVRTERVGQGGRPIMLYALRTLPRTPIGRFLRRWRLDKVPQWWNVFKGDMSLVGPCAEEPAAVAAYSDWHRRRLAVKPGLITPVQADGRHLPLDERVRLELEYIENYSLWRDVSVMARALWGWLKG